MHFQGVRETQEFDDVKTDDLLGYKFDRELAARSSCTSKSHKQLLCEVVLTMDGLEVDCVVTWGFKTAYGASSGKETFGQNWKAALARYNELP